MRRTDGARNIKVGLEIEVAKVEYTVKNVSYHWWIS